MYYLKFIEKIQITSNSKGTKSFIPKIFKTRVQLQHSSIPLSSKILVHYCNKICHKHALVDNCTLQKSMRITVN